MRSSSQLRIRYRIAVFGGLAAKFSARIAVFSTHGNAPLLLVGYSALCACTRWGGSNLVTLIHQTNFEDPILEGHLGNHFRQLFVLRAKIPDLEDP